MATRWQVITELTLDVLDDKEVEWQALERARQELNKVQGAGHDIAHYHIMKQPKKVEEFD